MMGISAIFYAIPLTAFICLAYTASRFELPERILKSALVMFVKTLGGLVLLYSVLWMFSS